MNNTQNTPDINNNDEIDLFELIETLWRNKGLIIAITLFCTIFAGLIAFFVIKPSYQSKVVISEPYIYQTIDLNQVVIGFSNEEDELFSNFNIPALTPEQLIKTLAKTAQSIQNLNNFFIQINNDTPNINSAHGLITVNFQDNILTISTISDNPEDAYLFTKEYLAYSQIQAAHIILKNRQAELNNMVAALKRDIKNLEMALDARHNYKLNELKNALKIAEKLNIKHPLSNIQDLYQLGIDVLQEKVLFTEATLNNYSQNIEHNLLTSKLASYESLKLPEITELIMYNTIEAANLNHSPIKPNKKLIIIIGFLLGGMLGVAFVLLRQAIRNYKLRTPKTPEAHKAY